MNTRAARAGLVLATAALVLSLFVLLAGQNPWHVLTTLLTYALGPQGRTEVLLHAIPLSLVGLGIAIALRSGLFNIGSDGQFTAGAVLSVLTSYCFADWGFAGLIAFLIAGFSGGALLGAAAGYLRARFGASEIIVTIMLNYIAAQTVSYLIRGPMEDAMRIFPRSYAIPDDCILPIIVAGSRLHAGLIVALAMTLLCAVLQRRTVFGFKASVLGANPGAALYAGLRTHSLTIAIMAISGGLAGLAGAVEVAGVYQRVEENMGEGLGLSGVAVALIARLEAAAVPFAACLFGVLFAGAGALQRELALPFPILWIVEAIVIFTVPALHWALRDPKAVV
jgi:general nucleoside transport system permease protein